MRVTGDPSEVLYEERMVFAAWWWCTALGSGFLLWASAISETIWPLRPHDDAWSLLVNGSVVLGAVFTLGTAALYTGGLLVQVSRSSLRVTMHHWLGASRVALDAIGRCQAAHWERIPLGARAARSPEGRALWRRCYCLGFLGPRTGVYLWLRDGKPLFISSRRPEELLAALAEAGVRVEPGVLELR